MAGPLEGLVVVDASWGLPGAAASMLLADYGARVIKVERPEGGMKGIKRKTFERGKWSVSLDLGSESGRAQLRDLLERSDVFLESFGVNRAEPLGLGYESLGARNPGLVQCSLTAYGMDDMPWRDRPGYEALVAARMGFMAEQPGHRPSPIFLGHPSIAYTTSLLAAIGILAAIRARHVTGRGQQVDVSLLDGVLGQAPMNWWWNERDESYLTTQEKGVFGNRRVIMDMFQGSDGEYVMVHTGGQGSFKATMDVLGLGEKIQVITDRVEMSAPLNDEEYAITREQVPLAWKAKTRDEWVRLLHEADVAAVPVLRPGEVLSHEQVVHANVPMELPDETYGTIKQVGPSIQFTTTVAPLPVPAPRVGEHDARLAEIPLRGASTATGTLRHALEGVRVLDFSQFFAAAYGVKIFSDLGADVIKVEATGVDPMRSLPDPFEAAQRGKRAIVLDLKTEAGRQVMRDLVSSADIVVHNLRPGKAEKIGLGYEDLVAVKPDLIYCYQPGWGSSGPSADLKSFAPLMSGLSGLMFEAAGEGNPPVRRARASEDYYGGLLGAAGILMALEHRNRTGEGQRLDCPQLHASLFCVTEQALDANGNLIHDDLLDAEQMGYEPLYRLYRTSDGYVCIACFGDESFARLRSALDLEDSLDDGHYGIEEQRSANAELLAKVLAERFAELSTNEAFDILDRNAVPVEVAGDTPFMPQFFWEQWAVDSGRVFEHHHREYGWIREVGLVIRMSETPGLQKPPAPLYGEHTREVLAEIGYSDERIDGLVAAGVCCEYEAAD